MYMFGVLVWSFSKQINASVEKQTDYAIPSTIILNLVTDAHIRR